MDVWFYTYGQGYAPAGWRIRSLPYTNRLYVVLGGQAFFIEHDGCEKRLLSNHVYLFPHRLPFCVRQDERDPVNHLYFDFMLAPPLLGEALVELPLKADSLMERTVRCLQMAVGRAEDAFLVRGYFQNLLSLVLRESGETPSQDERVNLALRHIHDHFGETLRDDALAKLVHLEKNHFIRLFRKTTGMTPYQYLREYRLNRACSLLTSGASASETALQCGYESAEALSHALRRSRNCCPAELRGGNSPFRMRRAEAASPSTPDHT